jgi:RNA polymerase sigma-70 factor, ECF subfamily
MADPSLHRGAFSQASSVSLAAQLLGKMTSASNAVERVEIQAEELTSANSAEKPDKKPG